MNKIQIEQFTELISTHNTGLIIGNGFSMNFDSCFRGIYDSLKEGNNALNKLGEFTISPTAYLDTRIIITQNYKNVVKYVRNFNQKQLEKIFEDAVDFAGFITTNSKINNFLEHNRHLNKFKAAPNMLEVTKGIYEIGSKKGFKSVNIENWPTLIWLYHLIENLPEFKKYTQKSNRFIKLLRKGWEKSIMPQGHETNVMYKTRFNGFSIYYRLLMITIIFGNGKAVDINKLEKINDIDQDSIKQWLAGFKELFSLNYDLILEQNTNRSVTYLHGHFQNKLHGFTYHQSYALKHGNDMFYTNDIILGDYTTTKMLDGIMHSIVLGKQALTQPRVDALEILSYKMRCSEISHIVFFGVHPENDYHILSGLYYHFLNTNVDNPAITYCYYNENEIEDFTNTLYHVVNSIYRDKDFINSISLSFVDSKEIVNKYFYINNPSINPASTSIR
ncbi:MULTISPECIES: hypothetical protein [Bacillus cereus group]|uniref:Uncharacterized protein n=2 Tax=Bacillus cereus group TaxID=86661 RepID=A0A9X6VAY0_BACTU|nr:MULTISPECIES: hypothetical protein [Bacillus cereus group]EXY07354.1 hypothetical protein BF15_16585 [Bacillus thuringiensis]MBY0131368.1 hypothetical protein [Bacillus cereus]MCU5277899.1 hypothetical protein [Bacillus cereus]MDN4874179.1 hypothetical protein [Bacillus cereus]MEB8634557.1 hypothetical protein [Bacillus cereus]